jgi:4-diphosphocytidyl-2-C-methyl-D-erythritol kinase
LEVYGLKIPGEISENILYKAWHLLHQNFVIPPIGIKILKGIPLGSGLGGGSADASFLIRSLNSYFKLNMSTDNLLEYAAVLGSDCSFFIKNKAAFVTGRGEIVEQVDLSLKGLHIAIVIPDIQISTKEAFQYIDYKEHASRLTEITKKPVDYWQDLLENDFERITFKKHPALKVIKDRMHAKGAIYASLSGSGGAVFGIFNQFISLNKYFPNYIIRHGVLN